ncbi:type VI secretion protein [Verminephrobacter aporrectodeae subsp. tuberculatae]|uniref:Type VI secretion protein n=1 Tax=Verminephrobacter aporrectodeae subsp. tuberculatae TaxID=1110392 RepID=A0ABT3L0C3_9BURK|nr:type IV secretion system DNA-binding domain-containing protein [Verminephrobacter aporrectodeae]MCW5323692.1 type VI secretion protein [Verminephrobacter aporrectodeae subsp. tuberculatae]
MANREEKGGTGSFSRGAELWMHQARMFVMAIWTVVLISTLSGLVVAIAYFWNVTTSNEKYALERNVLANTRDALYMTAGKMELNVNGELRNLEVSEVALLTDDMAEDAWRKLRNGGMFGFLTSIGVVFLVSLYWWGYGRSRMQDNQLRGATLVEGKELARLINHRNEASPYEIAGVPMRMKSETLHTLFAGAQGTGKSQQFFALMKQVRARGKRMIVYDSTGEFTQAFYREGKDILMNPLDARSPNWNVWNEISKDYHFDNIANGLIPDPVDADPFWALAGRMVLKDVIVVLGREGRRTNRDLYNAIAKSNLDAMHALLQGTAGATYVDPITERTGMSIKMTIQNQLEAFRFLPDDGDPFSIRKWMHEEGDSWMFITAREAMREALKPVMSLWIDTAIKAVLDLEPIHRERLWFCIDELPTLQKLDILKLALTNTRKYGLCMVLGVQDFSQVYEIYGHDLAKTIISGCQTKLLLRVTDGAAAKLLADLMGQAEVDEKDETLSYGLSPQRDGVSVMARRQMRDIVLTSQITTLPDMTGYLLVPGDYPIAKVKYGYVPTEKQVNGFIERGGFAISFKPTSTASTPASADARQPSVPEAADMLDDGDMDAPVTVEVMRHENSDVIDKTTGEINRPTAVSRAKEGAEAKPSDQRTKPNPLADAL